MAKLIEINAENQSLGRVASQAAHLLRGKGNPDYVPSKLPDVQVQINNIAKIKFTGDKLNQKTYYHYSGYHSGIRARKLSELWATRLEHVVRQSVYRMLPKNKIRDKIIKNLKFK